MTAAERLEQYGDRTRPGSAAHAALSDLSALYAAVPSLIYVVLSEEGGKGVDDHDRVANLEHRDDASFGDGMNRLLETGDLVYGLTHADDQERAEIAHALKELHRHIEGTLEDGRHYHARTKHLWAWTWAGILKPNLDAYNALRGPLTDEFLEDAYIGWLQLGDLIGVSELPDTYDEFLDYWEDHWKPLTRPTGTGKYIYDFSTRTPPPRTTPWMPRPVWDALSWPLRDLFRTSTFIVMDPQVRDLLELQTNRRQRASIDIHRGIWRVLPRPLTKNIVATYFGLRLRHGTPSWRRHYSAESLARYRQAVKDADHEGQARPPRPSVQQP